MGRRACSIGLVERPLVIGLCAGLVTGHSDIALPLGIIFELFWLDVIPLGAVIPPVASLNFFMVFCLALVFDWHNPAQFVLPLLLTLPCAWLGAAVERWQYTRNDTALEPLQLWMQGENKGQSPAQIIARSLLQTACMQGMLFLLLFSAAYALLRGGLDDWFVTFFTTDQVTWTILYGFAAVGAIVALRTRRAYVMLVACMAVLLLCNGLYG